MKINQPLSLWHTIVTVASIVFLPLCAWGQVGCNTYPSYRTERLLGDVQSISIATYKVADGLRQVRDGLSFGRSYNSQQCLMKSRYDVYREGEWQRSCTTFYDSLSLRILRKECEEGGIIKRWTYQAMKGREERYEGVPDNNMPETKQPEVLYYQDGVLTHKEAFVEPYFIITHYDQWKRVTRQETYSDSRQLKFSWERTYIDNEIVEEVQYTAGNRAVDRRLRYQHDFNRRITREDMYRRDGSHASTTTYYYNEVGLLLEVLKDYVSPGVKNDHTRYEYDFDNQGNWVERQKIFNGRLVKVEKRSLTYFGE